MVCVSVIRGNRWDESGTIYHTNVYEIGGGGKVSNMMNESYMSSYHLVDQ